MTDANVQLPNDGPGKKVATFLVGDEHVQKIALVDDAGASLVQVDAATGLGTGIAVGGETAGGVFKVLEVNASGHLNVSDGGGSITVDATSWPLPTDAATETTAAAISALQSEIRNLNDTMVFLLSSILEKMPRVTGNDQAAVSVEAGTVAVSSLPTLATVTTVGTVSNQTLIGGQDALTTARSQIMAGTHHIYNNIIVS